MDKNYSSVKKTYKCSDISKREELAVLELLNRYKVFKVIKVFKKVFKVNKIEYLNLLTELESRACQYYEKNSSTLFLENENIKQNNSHLHSTKLPTTAKCLIIEKDPSIKEELKKYEIPIVTNKYVNEKAKLPSFSFAEKLVMENISEINKEIINHDYQKQFKRDLKKISKLENMVHYNVFKEMTDDDCLAMLIGENGKFKIRRISIIIGRSIHHNKSKKRKLENDIDIDLALEISDEKILKKISRKQAYLFLDTDDKFYIKCIGQQKITVNAKTIIEGERIEIGHRSLIEITNYVSLMFVVNYFALERIKANSYNHLKM